VASTLSSIINQIESGGSTYQGPGQTGSEVFANFAFGQHPGFVTQYGSGATGVENYASQVLTYNPNATLGDFYSGYNLATGNPAVLPGVGALQTQNPAAYNNLVQNGGYPINTPLASLLGGSGGGGLSGGWSGSALASAYGPPVDISGYPVEGVDMSLSNANETFGSTGVGSGYAALQPDQSLSADSALYGLNAGTLGQTSGSGVGYNALSSPSDLTANDTQAALAAEPYGTAGTQFTAGPTQYTTASGTPLTITDASSIGTQAANTVGQSLTGLTQGVQQSEANFAQTGTGWLNSIFGGSADAIARIGFIFAGILILGGAFLFFYVEEKPHGLLAV
jgi:hypothetical protein